MGVVVSAIATGLVQNLERDFVKQPVVTENQSIDKHVDEEKYICKTIKENYENLVAPEPLNTDGNLNKQNKNNSKQKKVVKDSPSKIKSIAALETEKTDDDIPTFTDDNQGKIQEIQEENSPLNFFHDFFSSLGIISPVQEQEDPEDKTTHETPLSSLKNTVTFAEGFLESPKDTRMFDDYEDSLMPIINLLPRLTEDLEAGQRRPNPAWFRKSYTNISTVQKIYLTHPKCTPSRR